MVCVGMSVSCLRIAGLKFLGRLYQLLLEVELDLHEQRVEGLICGLLGAVGAFCCPGCCTYLEVSLQIRGCQTTLLHLPNTRQARMREAPQTHRLEST